MGVQKGYKVGGVISQNQQQILTLLTKNFLTVHQIAKVKSTSIWAVYKSIRKLKARGYYPANFGVGGHLPPPTPYPPHPQNTHFSKMSPTSGQLIRLHKLHFLIKVIHSGRGYASLIGKQERIEGHLIKYHKKKLEIYQERNTHFIGQNEPIAEAQAYAYFNGFIARLQAAKGLILLKGENSQIRQVNAHYAHINNGVAYYYQSKKEKLKLVDTDGRTYLIIDKSLDGHEMELIHPASAAEDSRKLSPYIEDMRNNNPPTMSQLSNLLKIYGIEPPKTQEKLDRDLASYFG